MFGCLAPAAAQPVPRQLADLSLEELSNIEITSVSKRAERLADAPTSVFVITADDIRHAGATSLPEALRLAPALQVARVSAGGYAISVRGFNGSSANKLLVLIDGRSVYSPLFSGVFWDVQDLMLEDIERIEVISGPGGTLWGVNAVNGVINVITRSAADTQGTLLAAGAGNREAQLSVRHGARLGDTTDVRVYARRVTNPHTETAGGSAVDDAGQHNQAGFRLDRADSGTDKFSLHGDIYDGRHGQPRPGSIVTGAQFELGEITLSGANLVGNWEHRFDAGSSLAIQAYYDRTQRTVPPTFAETLDQVDLQLQHSLQPWPGHAFVWGGEVRYAMDRVTNSSFFAFLPADVDQTVASLFAQDEVTLRDDLRLSVGMRIEHNGYTGNEFLPNARLAWKLAPAQLLWAAASRTVRAPSRLDRDPFVPGQAPFLLAGGPDVRSETAKVYELGYRGQPSADSSASVTLYRADYDRLHTQEVAPSRTFLFFDNGMEGRVSGAELWGAYQALPNWRLKAGLSRLWQDLRLKPGSNDAAAVRNAEGANPDLQWQLRSSLDLGHQTEFDAGVRHVSALSSPAVPAYTAVDLRLAWRPRQDLELSVSGQNLFDAGHGEFTSVTTRSELGRAVFVRLVSRY